MIIPLKNTKNNDAMRNIQKLFAVQVVISCEWYMMNKPIGHISTDEEFPKCNVSRNRFLILHSYPAALLIIAFCYGKLFI